MIPSGAGGFRIPGEWEPQEEVWTAWPSHEAYWEGMLEAAREELSAFLRVLAKDAVAKEALRVVVWLEGEAAAARDRVGSGRLEWMEGALGDIWLRDTGPIVGVEQNGRQSFRAFRHNGWGGKFMMAGDESLGSRMMARAGLSGRFLPVVGEGGALEFNGDGLVLTTRSCLLNPNRNGPGWTEAYWETLLREHFGVEQVIWLDEGLRWDHTDGHIDNVARFVGPWTVVCQHAENAWDPQRERLEAVERQLRAWRSASGSRLEVVSVPSAGKVVDQAGNGMPASHVNFLITNHCVVVPCYGAESEDRVVATLADLFPDREVVSLPAWGLLHGGGAFHCCTQQKPAVPEGNRR